MAEKRNISRFRKRLAVRFGVQGPDRMAFTEDISDTGLFVKTTNICPPGTKVQVILILPDDHHVTLEGRVMWAKKVPANMIRLVNKCGMGIRILRFLSGEEHYVQLISQQHR